MTSHLEGIENYRPPLTSKERREKKRLTVTADTLRDRKFSRHEDKTSLKKGTRDDG